MELFEWGWGVSVVERGVLFDGYLLGPGGLDLVQDGLFGGDQGVHAHVPATHLRSILHEVQTLHVAILVDALHIPRVLDIIHPLMLGWDGDVPLDFRRLIEYPLPSPADTSLAVLYIPVDLVERAECGECMLVILK